MACVNVGGLSYRGMYDLYGTIFYCPLIFISKRRADDDELVQRRMRTSRGAPSVSPHGVSTRVVSRSAEPSSVWHEGFPALAIGIMWDWP